MKRIINKYLDELISLELNTKLGEVEIEMLDKSYQDNEGYKKWLPIESKASNLELKRLEKKIGHPLPKSYKKFLKTKHFYEFYLAECSFCPHPIYTWQSELLSMIFNGYPSEFLVEKGRIPFANWSDWGLLCFDATVNHKDNDYPVVLWDHEIFDEFEYKFENFEIMLEKLVIEHESQKKV